MCTKPRSLKHSCHTNTAPPPVVGPETRIGRVFLGLTMIVRVLLRLYVAPKERLTMSGPNARTADPATARREYANVRIYFMVLLASI